MGDDQRMGSIDLDRVPRPPEGFQRGGVDGRYEDLVRAAGKSVCDKRSDHWDESEDRSNALDDAVTAAEAMGVRGMLDALHLALDKISPCVVGWDDAESMPTFARELWQVVNPIQACLGIGLTDIDGTPKEDT